MKKESCFRLGTFTRKHGYKGELNAKLEFSSPSVFKTLKYVFIELNGNLVPFFITTFRFKNNGIALLKFEDINTDEEAESLVGKSIYLSLDYMPKDNNPHHAFINFTANDKIHGDLGLIVSIQDNQVQSLFVIDYNGKNVLIPIVEAYIQKIDHQKKVVYLNTPPGLIELYI